MSNLQTISKFGRVDVRVEELADNLRAAGDGLWMSKTAADVSYPEDGHDQCFAIEDDSFWFVHRNNVIVDTMRRFPPDGIVFDIGGGNGFVTAAMRREGFDSILVEPGIDGARNAVRRGLDPVICASLDEAGFRPESLPAVGLFDVVEHIEDDAGFLRRLHGLITPNGRLYATVPTLSWLWSADDVRAGHFRRYTVESFGKLLSDCGFMVEFSTSFFGFLVAPVFLRRAVPTRLGLRSDSGDEYIAEHAPSSPWAQRLLDRWSARELDRMGRGRRLRRGTSCIVVARAGR